MIHEVGSCMTADIHLAHVTHVEHTDLLAYGLVLGSNIFILNNKLT